MASVVQDGNALAPIGTGLPQRTIRPVQSSLQNPTLSTLIVQEIIPRLIVSHPTRSAEGRASAASAPISAAEVAAFAPLALHAGVATLIDVVEQILARGVGIESVMIDLLAPAARKLGDYWSDDRSDFVDITMALWRLQEVVHEFAGRADVAIRRGGGGRRALFTPVAGDQHDFGTVLIEEVFHGEGWITDRLCVDEAVTVTRRVASEWLDLVALTVTCDCHIAPLASTIAALRSVARNPRVCIMVGGRVFNDDPGLALRVGADGTAGDARAALKVASDLVRARAAEGLVSRLA